MAQFLLEQVIAILLLMVAHTYSVLYSGTNAGITYSILTDDTTTTITLSTSSSNANKWLAMGFDANEMDGTYTVIYSPSTGTVQERILGYHNEGSEINSTFEIISDEYDSTDGRVVVIQRDNTAGSSYTFTNTQQSLQLIIARGSDSTFSTTKHAAKAAVTKDDTSITTTESYTTTSTPGFDEIINVALNRTGYWSSANVSCSAGSNCYVNCIGDYACSYIDLLAKESNNLYVNCQGFYACSGMMVYAPSNGNNFELTCNHSESNSNNSYYYWSPGACMFIDVYADNVRNIDVNCYKEEDCYYMYLYVNNAKNVNVKYDAFESGRGSRVYAQNVTNSVNLICDGKYACTYASVWCPDSKYDTMCDVDCTRDSSCARMNYYIESAKTSNLDITCDFNKTHCFKAADEYYWYEENAEIICQDTGYRSDLVYNKYDESLSCHAACCPFEVLEIECGASSNCIIDCTTQFCEGHLINATDKLSLHVICDENEYNSTCDGLLINCPDDGICDVECDSYDECKKMIILSNGPSDISIRCTADESCEDMIVEAPNANSISINSTGTWGLYFAEIHAENVNEFNLLCKNTNDGYWDYGACYGDSLYLPSDGNADISINCYGASCYSLQFYVTDGMNAVSEGINVVSYCQCGDGEWQDCIGWWSISCGDNYQNNVYYYGYWDDQCWSWNSSESDVCGCESMADNLETNYVDVDDSYVEVDCCDYSWYIDYGWEWDYDTDYYYGGSADDECDEDSGEAANADGLTSGEITGIVLAILAVIGLVFFIWFFCDKRRKSEHLEKINLNNPESPRANMIHSDDNYVPPETDGTPTMATR